MTTAAALTAIPHTRSIGRSHIAAAHLSGLLLFAAGVTIVLVIITAEALYPIAYSTGHNEISDLGGTRPPGGLVFQPSATIFNIGMMLSGLLVTLAAAVLHRVFGRWWLSSAIGILGISALLVGIFPGNTGTPHAVAAMVAFISGGVAAVLSAQVTRSPIAWAFRLLGGVNLALLGSYFIQGDASPAWALGTGGAERWIVYPILLWLVGFGGYLAGLSDERQEGADRGRLHCQPGTATPVPN